MTHLFERCGGECFILADSKTGFAGVITFDACGFDPFMSTELLSRKARGFRLAGERRYTAMDAYRETYATRHYAEMNDVHITPTQRAAWLLDPCQEW